MHQKEWEETLTQHKAFWEHDGNPNNPHIVLPNGLHSNFFFDLDRAIMANLLHDMCEDLITQNTMPQNFPDMVIGCGSGGIEKMAVGVCNVLGGSVRVGFVQKIRTDGQQSMMLTGSIGAGMNVLLIHDFFTTGETVRGVAKLVRAQGALLSKTALLLLNRSGYQIFEGMRLRSLIDRPHETWKPSSCPLCKKGSRAVRAKNQ